MNEVFLCLLMLIIALQVIMCVLLKVECMKLKHDNLQIKKELTDLIYGLHIQFSEQMMSLQGRINESNRGRE